MFYRLEEKNSISLRGKNKILKEWKGVRIYLRAWTSKWIIEKGVKNR